MRRGSSRGSLLRRYAPSKKHRETPPPLVGGGWGEGLVGGLYRPTPPPNPLPQGEGETLSFARRPPSFIQGGSAAGRWSTRNDRPPDRGPRVTATRGWQRGRRHATLR